MRLDQIKQKFKGKLKRPEDYYIKILLKETKLKDIMTPNVVTISVNAHFSKVVELFNRYGFRHLPVVDKENRIKGLITQRDLFKLQSPRKLENGELYYDPSELDRFILAEVMIHEPFNMKLEDCLGDALLAMVEHKYGCIPIVDKNSNIQGIITQMDIMEIAAAIYLE